MRKVHSVLSVVLVFSLLASACGDDDSESAVPTTGAPVATTGDSGSGDADDGDDGGDFGDVGELPGVLSSNDCLATATALASAFSGGLSSDGTFDPEGIADSFDRLSELAPSEIQGDIVVMADGLGLFFSVLDANNIDLGDPASMAAPGVAEAMEEAAEALDSADFEEASDNVNAWFESMCSGG